MPLDTSRDANLPRSVAEPDVELGDIMITVASPDQESRPRLRLQLPGDGEEAVIPGASTMSLDAGMTGSRRASENVEKQSSNGLFKSPRPSSRIPKLNIPKFSFSKHYDKLKSIFPGLDISWVTNNLDATHVKPAIRGAVAAWVSLILMVVPKTERAMGQASFLILVASFLSPPTDPFTAVIEREIAILLFATISFAWSALGIRLSNLARTEFNHHVTQAEIFSGRFIEAWPAVICGVFLFIGTSSLLYLRARVGPGPYIIPMILSCIMIDISLTVAPMFPYPTYVIGESVLIPLAFHSAVSITCSIVVFPETINAQFIKRFQGVFRPLSKAIMTQANLLETSPISDDFDPQPFIKHIAAAEAALAPLAATSRLMKKDISWGRFGSKDFSRLHELARRMAVRANGMAFYFKIIDPVVDKQPGTPALSRLSTPASTPMGSRVSSRPPSPTRHSQDGENLASDASISSSTRRRRKHKNNLLHYSFHLSRSLHHRHHHHHLPSSFIMHIQHPSSLFHEIVERSAENPVGVFESQRYLNLETRLTHPSSNEYITQIMGLLKESVEELLACNVEALNHVTSWLERMNQERFFKLFFREKSLSWEDTIKQHEDMKSQLQKSLDEFRDKKRHRVLDMYRDSLRPRFKDDIEVEEPPPHRYLFQSYLYQYHLIIFSSHLLSMLDEMIDLEKSRRRSRLWLPILPWRKIFIWSKWEPNDTVIGHNEDEDPNIIPGIDPESHSNEDLGQPRRRDPDALPPSNALEALGTIFYRSVGALGHGNAIFGFKAGILTILLSLPNFFKSSAEFVYINRSVWAIVIGQLTLSRFRGDTAFGWSSRVIATFLGGLIGSAIWHISTGSGKGNPYGLAAVTAVCFPAFFFAKLYFPASPMTLTIFFVTTVLVVGYSWQDTHFPTLSNAGWGLSVAWKRFVLVTIGVTVAFIFSFLPPSTTLRRYLRTTYATTAEQIGQLYCDIVSYATVPDGTQAEDIVRGLIAVRLKLKRNLVLKKNVSYEFSLRGKWPMERYNTIHEIQMEIAYLLSHLRSVTEHLELPWAKAFLRRTRFLEPDFQGDVLAVITLISTSLRTGTPLPQVTPCPLLNRFTARHHGLNIVRDEQDDDYGLPRTLTIDTLENEQYMYFSVGVSTAYGIVSRLDRLMIATKALVGEQYHINGLPLYVSKRH